MLLSSRVLPFLLVAAFAPGISAVAQTAPVPSASVSAINALRPVAQADRVGSSPDFRAKAALHGHVPAWATADRQVTSRAADLSQTLQLSITLQRAPQVQAAFEQLLAVQQNPASPLYHQWLTATQVGELYGPTQHDVNALTSWLAAQGLTVIDVAPSRMLIDVQGSTSAVSAAFATSFAYYNVAGNERRAARTEPQVPAVLAPLIAAVGGLAEIYAEPQSHMQPLPASSPYLHKSASPAGVAPDYTAGASTYYLTAGDFDTIYDINSVITGGNLGATIAGTAQNVAIIGRSQVTTADITNYMANFGANGQTGYHLTQTQVPTGSGGNAIGIAYNGDTQEATLDVQRVVGTANGAQAVLLYSASGNGTDGVDIATNYNVNTLMYPVMTISFGSCEAGVSAATVSAKNAIYSQAAAEGISTFVSAGDSAAAGCDAAFTAPPATQQLSANFLCASGYVTCVGGTEFADASNYASYWNTTNSAGYVSAKGYIPEGAWNEPGNAGSYVVTGTGGGVSIYTTKPTFQTGTGVPADGYRDTPDMAFTAAQHDGYLGYYTASSTASQSLSVFAGTSAAAPGMAGVSALLNTKLGFREGALNPLLYKLAATNASAFHDVTVASSGVGTCSTSTPSMCNNSTPGSSSSLTGGLAGYAVTAGYDQATGWGSLDVANFLAAAAGANLTVASSHSGTFATGGASNTYTLTVTNSGAAAGAGTVSVTDTLPSGFTATAVSGTGWTCTLSSITCTRTDALAANSSYAAITLTVTVTAAGGASYANTAKVSVGGTLADTATDPTYVAAATLAPTLTVAFNPASIGVGATSSMTYTFQNPNSAASGITLTGIGFNNTLPTSLTQTAPTQFACTSGATASEGYNSTYLVISGGSIPPQGYCLITLPVTSSMAGSFKDTTSTITATNSSAGSAASATLTVVVTPTRLVFTQVPPASLTAGGNAGTVAVALEDASGNVATSNTGTTVTLAVSGPSGYAQTYSASTASGVATFNLSSVALSVAGTYTYTASSSGFTSVASTETVNAGAATALTVTGLTTFTAPQINGTATVTARDAYGNVATGFTGTVTLTTNDSTATLSPASYTYVAGDAGVHSFTVTFNTAGTFVVAATSGSAAGSEVGILVQDAIWVLNTTSTLARTTDAGAQTSAVGSAATGATYGAVAVDNAGDVWAVSNSTNSVLEFTRTAAATTVSGSSAAGVTAPSSLFIDGLGQVWIANGNSTVSVLTNAGAAISPSTGYAGGGLSSPSGILVDSAGSVWISNRGGNSVTKIFGAAAPVTTPTVTSTTSNTLGARP